MPRELSLRQVARWRLMAEARHTLALRRASFGQGGGVEIISNRLKLAIWDRLRTFLSESHAILDNFLQFWTSSDSFEPLGAISDDFVKI